MSQCSATKSILIKSYEKKTPFLQTSINCVQVYIYMDFPHAIRETRSHANHQGTPTHCHISLWSHYGLVIALKVWTGQHDFRFFKTKRQKRQKKCRQGMTHQTFPNLPLMPGISCHHQLHVKHMGYVGLTASGSLILPMVSSEGKSP